MSQPARPTLLNRNATLAPAAASRMSDAIAMMAPAPAQMPSTAAITGCGQARIALTRSPVIRVKAVRPLVSILHQWADDLEHVAAGRKIAAGAGDDDGLHLLVHRAGAEEIRQFAVALEGQRIFALGTVQGHGGDAVDHGQQEMLRRIIGQRQRDGIGGTASWDLPFVFVVASLRERSDEAIHSTYSKKVIFPQKSGQGSSRF